MKKLHKQSLLLVALLPGTFNLKSQPNLDVLPPQIVKDTFYGKVVEDPYRFMENSNDPRVIDWLHKQTDLATAILGKITNRDAILAKQKASRGKNPRNKYLKITENNNYFYLKKEADEKLYKLYYRMGFYGNEELLFDPVNYNKSSGDKYIINFIQPSWDATKIAVGFTKNDEEFSELVVLNVNTKKLYPDVITHCWPSELGGISWLKDNSGFFYTHIPVLDKTSEDYILNTASVLYKLGSKSKKLNVLLSAKNNPDINIKPEDFPIIYYNPYYENILIGGIEGAGAFIDYYYSKINSKGEISEWKPLSKRDDKIEQFIYDGKDFYFLSAFNTPNYKLCKTSFNNPDFKNPEILVEEDSNMVITDFALAKNGVYYVKTKNGIDAQLYCLKDDKEHKIISPKQSGHIDVISKSPNSLDLWIKIEGWTNRPIKYRYDITKEIFIQEDLYPYPQYPELNDAVIEEIEITSHDGVKVPFSIIHKKGIKLNGNNRTFITGYGAFGYSNSPFLNPYILHWVREGGIYAVAHVRGGGEKGEAWHKGGFKQTKPNSWKDFIACTQYLINKKYTNPDKIAAWGGSAGGILIARAITERPDLYRTAIISSGAINMLRFEFGPNGKNVTKEFGTVEDSTEFQALFEMDAYQHVKSGTNYPSVLLQTGINDSRLPVWNSSKFAARLQAAETGETPILLSIDFGGGHGFDMTSDKRDQNTIDILTFALWQTGHPDFQLKE